MLNILELSNHNILQSIIVVKNLQTRNRFNHSMPTVSTLEGRILCRILLLQDMVFSSIHIIGYTAFSKTDNSKFQWNATSGSLNPQPGGLLMLVGRPQIAATSLPGDMVDVLMVWYLSNN
jgi:hypothetical protein